MKQTDIYNCRNTYNVKAKCVKIINKNTVNYFKKTSREKRQPSLVSFNNNSANTTNRSTK